MQEKQQIHQSEETQILVEDRALDDFAPLDEHPADQNGALVDANAYQQEVIMREWTPDEANPNYKFKIWLLPRVMKGSDKFLTQRKVAELEMSQVNLQRLRKELAGLKLDSRYERNERTLLDLSPLDAEFAGDENKYFDKKEHLQKQLDTWMREYSEAVQSKEEAINKLLALPNYYQTLRLDLFDKVITDHTIGLPVGPNGALVKVDFKSEDTKFELADEMAASLQEFIWDVLGKESRGQKKKRR